MSKPESKTAPERIYHLDRYRPRVGRLAEDVTVRATSEEEAIAKARSIYSGREGSEWWHAVGKFDEFKVRSVKDVW